MPTDEIRATVTGFIEDAKDVKADNSATVTIWMKDGSKKKLYEKKIQSQFTLAGKKWKVINFERESRQKPVASYTVTFEGKT